MLLLVYGGLMGLTYLGFQAVPVGFIPDQDKGYLVVNVQLPDGASLERCDAIMRRLKRDGPRCLENSRRLAHDRPVGLFHLAEHEHQQRGRHVRHSRSRSSIAREMSIEVLPSSRPSSGKCLPMFARESPCSAPRRSTVWARPAASRCRSRTCAARAALQGAVQNLADQGNADPRLVGLFSSFSVDQPQLFVEIDREKLKSQKVSLEDVNRTLQDLSRQHVCQRLHEVQPQLASECPSGAAQPIAA